MTKRPLQLESSDSSSAKSKTSPHPQHSSDKLFEDLGIDLTTALTSSYTFTSPLPDTTATEYILGVDEAGRGPVLGPMVYAACFSTIADYDSLKTLGFADSKQLSSEQRSALFAKLNQPSTARYAAWAVRCLSPSDISESMLRKTKYNLNALAHDATIHLLRHIIDCNINVRQVFVDTVGPPASYEKKLRELFPGIDIVVAKKADAIYPIVSAASVCAKVVRDVHLSRWVFAEPGIGPGIGFGSGYPADPNTVRWLRDSVDYVFGYPSIIRFSWSTCQRLLEENAARVVWPDDDASLGEVGWSSSRYFGRASERKRSSFFSRRALSLNVTL